MMSTATGFYAETFVTMESGKVREIGFIDAGDMVLSRNEVTGELAPRKVLKTIHRDDVELFYMGYGNPEGGEGTLVTTTAEHPFWVWGKGWTELRNLQSGDLLLSLDGKRPPVLWVKPARIRPGLDMYNLEVEEFNTFFADDIWVHDAAKITSRL